MILCSREESGASALRRKVSWSLAYKMATFGSEGVFEKRGNWLSHSVLGLLNPLKLEEQKSYWIIWSIELMCCEDSLVFITCCKFIKGAQPSAVFKRESCMSSVPCHHEGRRRKEETVILFIRQQRNFIISWRGLVVISRAEVPPVFSSHNVAHILSHLSWWLVGENPPNFPGQEEGPCNRALSVVI